VLRAPAWWRHSEHCPDLQGLQGLTPQARGCATHSGRAATPPRVHPQVPPGPSARLQYGCQAYPKPPTPRRPHTQAEQAAHTSLSQRHRSLEEAESSGAGGEAVVDELRRSLAAAEGEKHALSAELRKAEAALQSTAGTLAEARRAIADSEYDPEADMYNIL
jgi:hypothetical protein